MSAPARRYGRVPDPEGWIARVRLVVVPFAFFDLYNEWEHYPSGERPYAIALTVAFAAGAIALFLLRQTGVQAGLPALAFDTAMASLYVVLIAFDPGTAVRMVLLLPVIEGALRYGLRGGIATPPFLVPALYFFEARHADFVGYDFNVSHVLAPFGMALLVGVLIGLLTEERRS